MIVDNKLRNINKLEVEEVVGGSNLELIININSK